MINPFNNPQYYRKKILEWKLLSFPKINFTGKSLACLFITRFCGVGCPFCFFKSAPSWRKNNIQDEFNNEGINKFIKFARSANIGYLLLSGGGEPLNKKKTVLKIIEESPIDRIVLVTSGNWAKYQNNTTKYIDQIYDSALKNKNNTHVVIRVSVSKYHAINLGIDCALNIIKTFEIKDYNEKIISLQIKTFKNDNTLKKLLSKLRIESINETTQKLISDNSILEKIIPEKVTIKLQSGLILKIGLSEVFESTNNPDLRDPLKCQSGIKIFNNDLKYSEKQNPSIIKNYDETYGLDWSINYNGNISIWQNQVRDTYKNLYEDSYQEILQTYLEDPLTYSFIHKGNNYRNKIINEVNPQAVLRASAIGLRDAMGAILFEEEKTRLYYTIRVLHDYLNENLITKNNLIYWPKDLLSLVKLSPKELKYFYNYSNHNIIIQQKEKPFNKTEWQDFLELIKFQHYQLNNNEIKSAIDYYNKFVDQKINSLNDIKTIEKNKTRRLIDRLMYIKKFENCEYNCNLN
ncbi:MAG: 4Fe-4S cluster-binding domain-containing protein [Bacteroidetes bacterium]|nr:4Fe-4S cluster-binding domain-containing protein [Bacteroidota bacterium]